ncbi:hypothetical protein KJ359_006235 [Pestalotiopsis sp. 9143b]|nr:hypothetical protein KJ359_006235 [Pestalotiopsis sp. 9143b]
MVGGDSDSEVADLWRWTIAILRICQLMTFEVVELMTQRLCFNVTDLQTMDALFDVPSTSLSAFSFRHSILPRVTQLGITLRLDLPTFQALEASVPTSENMPSTELTECTQIWSSVAAKILELQKLCQIRVWMDHSDVSFWAVVNERALLSPFERLAIPKQLNLVFYLPFVHPQLEDSTRHYIEKLNRVRNSPTTTFMIRRFLRQRLRPILNDNGVYGYRYRLDFPILWGEKWYEMPLNELVKKEGRWWRTGRDVMGMYTRIQHITWPDDD